MDKDVSLADKAIRWTRRKDDPIQNELRLAYKSKVLTKNPESVLEDYRSRIQRAQRFVLDDKFIRLLVPFMTMPLKDVVALVDFARVPFTDVWIEFKTETYVNALHKAGHARMSDKPYDNPTQRTGALFRAMDPQKRMWQMTPFFEEPDVWLYASPGTIEHVFSTDLEVVPSYDGSLSKLLPDYPFTEHLEPEKDARLHVLGFQKGVDEPVGQWHELARHCVSRKEAQFRLYDQAMSETIRQAPFMAAEYEEHYLRTMIGALHLEYGHVRLFMCALALINQSVTHTVYRQGGAVLYKGKRQPFLSHKLVTLEVPNTKTIVRYIKQIAAIARKRAHKVRGHWRTYKRLGYSRWIDEHERGDSSLGYVTHDYEVTTPN